MNPQETPVSCGFFFDTDMLMTVQSLRRAAMAAVLVATAAAAPRGEQAAKSDDPQALQKRIAALEAGQQAILKELQEIKALLASRSAPPLPAAPASPSASPGPAAPVPIAIVNSASHGAADAKLTIVEFSDFECPFCGRYSRETYAQIQREYVDTGKVRYVFRNLPLENSHPQAFGAAVAGECARTQGKFWEMHDRMFANQRALTPPLLTKTAESLGLNLAAFQACVAGEAATKKVRQDMADAAVLGANATPMFYIGVVEKDGRLRAIRRVQGAKVFQVFKSVIDPILASPELKD